MVLLLSDVYVAGKSLESPEIMALVNEFSAVGAGIQQERHYTHTHADMLTHAHIHACTRGTHTVKQYYICIPSSAFRQLLRAQ